MKILFKWSPSGISPGKLLPGWVYGRGSSGGGANIPCIPHVYPICIIMFAMIWFHTFNGSDIMLNIDGNKSLYEHKSAFNCEKICMGDSLK